MSGGTSRSSGSHGRSTPTSHVLSLYPHAPKISSQSATSSSPALTPRALLQRHTLPVAAHLHTPTQPPAGIDTKKPILLYKTSHVDKIRAESLRPTADGSLAAVGPTLVVPDTYTGWFSIVGSSGCSAVCYSSVGQVVKRQPTCFLTRYDVPAYTQSSRDQGGEGSRPYQRGTVHGGEVLKLLALRRHQEGHEQYAECLNYKKQVVLVPLSATGRFYVTAEKSSHNMDQVYLVSQLVSSFQLPITVRLVCGYMPRTPCAFTGILRLTKCQKESVILACTMTSRADATLLEMDLASNFLLSPVTDPLFSKSPIYLKTLSYCDDEATHWQRQIKVTHHVTERRSRSLTRSFSDKFVDVPLQNQRPLSLSALTSVDRVKPRPSNTSGDNRIGRLASKVRKIKQSKRKDAPGKENDASSLRGEENDSILGSKIEGKEGQSPGTKLFEKHRKLSKQNTYVKEINRKNRPLPDPHENENNKTNSKVTLKESLTSLRKYNKKIKNRPLPNPNEIYSEDEDNLPFLKYKFIKTSRDGIEYCRVLDDINSPLPESLFEDDTEDEVDTENLYSEIEDYMSSRNDIDLSDEEIDSATYSNENSSKENSIDTKMTRTNQGLIKFRERVSRNIEVEAMIHCRAGPDDSDMRDEMEESDHYATLTIDGDDDDDEEAEEEEADFSCTLSESKWHRNMKRDLDTISDKSLRSDEMKDSLEDLSTIEPFVCSSAKDSDLKTFVADDGTIRKKYIVRQRTTNVYESLEEVNAALKMEQSSSDNTEEEKELNSNSTTDRNVVSDPDECTLPSDKTGLVPNIADVDYSEASQSPYTSMITMVDAENTENTDWSTSISIQRKPSPVESSSDANSAPSVGDSRSVLTSSRSIANLCDEEDLTSIQMRGNTILIKVQDDPLAPSIGTAYLNQDNSCGLESSRSLKKSPSVSSINILLDDNEDERILANGVSHISSIAKEKDDGIHRRFPSMVAIAENSGDYGEECNEITYYNDTCLSIAVANMGNKDGVFDIASPRQSVTKSNTDPANCPHKGTIEILSTSNELIITGDSLKGRGATDSAEADRKSVDSGNATDDINDRDDSFDADSLAGDSEETRIQEADNPDMNMNPDDESDGELSVDFDHFKEASEIQTSCRDVMLDCEDDALGCKLVDPCQEGLIEDCSCSRRAVPPLNTIPEDDLYSNLLNADPDLSSVSFPSITFPVASTYAFGTNTDSYLASIQEESQSLLNTSTESACSTESKSEEYTPLEPFHSAVMPLSHSEPLFSDTTPSCISPTFTSSLVTKSSLRKMATLERSTSASPKLSWGSDAQIPPKCFYNSPMSSLVMTANDASNEVPVTSMETSPSSGRVSDTEPVLNDTNSGSNNQIVSPSSDVVMQSVQSDKLGKSLTGCKDDDCQSMSSSRLNRSPDSSYDSHSTSSSNSELDSSSVLSTSDSGICFIQIK